MLLPGASLATALHRDGLSKDSSRCQQRRNRRPNYQDRKVWLRKLKLLIVSDVVIQEAESSYNCDLYRARRCLYPCSSSGCRRSPLRLGLKSIYRRVSLLSFFKNYSNAGISSDQIIQIAKQNNADAIIPGYGFLSENADFARAVAAAGLVFVGPSPESIEAFGLKHTARELATKAGVPIVPGSPGLIENEDDAVEVAQKLGYPVCIVKQ
jgi:hypothetical protein